MRWTISAAVVASIAWPGILTAATLHVPTDYPTIQGCIDAAVSGVDECVVAPGTYNETINFLGKAITLRGSGGRDVTTIDASGIGGSVVTCVNGEGPDTVLEGFTIKGGTGTNLGGEISGGGMLNSGGSPTVINCTFSENTAHDRGGGMYNAKSSPTVTHCTFSRNSAGIGGGMYNVYYSNPNATNCTFTGNTADHSGGGMYNDYYCNPFAINCTFTGNIASHFGGGMHNEYSSPMIKNCTFAGNAVQNLSDGGGAISNNDYSGPIVTDCVLWGNRPDEFFIDTSLPIIRFSDVQGGLPAGAVDGGGNIDLDPMFVRAPDPGPDGMWDGVDDDYGDLRLQAGSPCINAGDPAFVPQPGETDLDGQARVLCGRVDMGAYEFGIGDYDCNQTVNLTDFAAWHECMTGPQSPVASTPGSDRLFAIGNRQLAINCEAFNFDGDGDIDLEDFSEMQRRIVP